MKQRPTYDYIIAGMGCAGLSLAVRLIDSGLPFQKILVVDRDFKTFNDRTWCFWSKDTKAWYDPILFKCWEQVLFNSPRIKKTLSLAPYRYQMIRGIDYYTFCLNKIKTDTRFEIRMDDILEIGTENNLAFLRSVSGIFYSHILFNSVFKNQAVKKNHVNLVQHFKGWLVETKEAVFDAEMPVFMDFNTEQENDCRFFYVIPYSKNKALIEYTGFSARALSIHDYDTKIKNYLETQYKPNSYKILETETGLIPMAESAFVNPYGKKVINIGVAGGSSKPSTGYTFYFIQKNTEALILQLQQGAKNLLTPQRQKRFLFYDRILLDVLHHKRVEASEVFSSLFKKNKIQTLLSFLNEETSLKEELSILNTVNKNAFVKSAIKKYFS